MRVYAVIRRGEDRGANLAAADIPESIDQKKRKVFFRGRADKAAVDDGTGMTDHAMG